MTPSQLAYWRRSGLVRPGWGELTQARTIAALRRAGLSPRGIRAAVERLRLLPDAGSPPASGPTRLAVHGQELFVQRAGGAWEGDRAPGQLILDGVVPLVPVDGLTVGPLPGGIPPGSETSAGARPRRGAASAAGDGGDGSDGHSDRGHRRPEDGGRAASAAARDQIRQFLGRQQALDPPRQH